MFKPDVGGRYTGKTADSCDLDRARTDYFSFNMYVNLSYVLTMICSEVGPVLYLRGKVNCEFSGCIWSHLPLP